MKKETNFEVLATKYGLESDFVKELYDKVTDKENIERALRMFVNGSMPYDVATGNDPINVTELRHKRHMEVKAAVEQQRKLFEYYKGCVQLSLLHSNKTIRECVYIKDGHLVAFGHYQPGKGGIYAANNEVTPNFNWTPHKWLARLRKMKKAFYREVKKAAFNSPREWFDFNI